MGKRVENKIKWYKECFKMQKTTGQAKTMLGEWYQERFMENYGDLDWKEAVQNKEEWKKIVLRHYGIKVICIFNH